MSNWIITFDEPSINKINVTVTGPGITNISRIDELQLLSGGSEYYMFVIFIETDGSSEVRSRNKDTTTADYTHVLNQTPPNYLVTLYHNVLRLDSQKPTGSISRPKDL